MTSLAEPMAQALAALLADHLRPAVVEAVAAAVASAVAEQARPPVARLLTISEAAELAAVHPETIRRAVKSGALPACTALGSHPRIRAEDLERFLEPVPAVAGRKGGRA